METGTILFSSGTLMINSTIGEKEILSKEFITDLYMIEISIFLIIMAFKFFEKFSGQKFYFFK